MLENTLAAYEPEEVVALLSSFVFQEKTDVQPVFPPRLEEGRDALVAISDRVVEVQVRHKVAADEHRGTLNFGLMEAVYEWAKGMVGICCSLVERLLIRIDGLLQPFDQLTMLTDVAEGTIVRVITRLDETCREVRDAARVIGDAVLMKKMEEAQMKIKRDSECFEVLMVRFSPTRCQQLYLLLVCTSSSVTSLREFIESVMNWNFIEICLFYPFNHHPASPCTVCHPLLPQMNQPIQLEKLLLMIIILSMCNPIRPTA